MLYYSTLFAFDFYGVIIDSAFGLTHYDPIEISYC